MIECHAYAAAYRNQAEDDDDAAPLQKRWTYCTVHFSYQIQMPHSAIFVLLSTIVLML